MHNGLTTHFASHLLHMAPVMAAVQQQRVRTEQACHPGVTLRIKTGVALLRYRPAAGV
jgi:hypothetical protein